MWQTKKLADICDFYNGLWKGKTPPFINVGVIRNTNFTKDCNLDDSEIAQLDVEKKLFEKRKLQFGDLVVEKSGGGPKQPVGRMVIFNKKSGDYSFSNFTSTIRIKNPKEIDFNYLHKILYLKYISGETQKMQSHSTGIRNLNINLFKNIDINFPDMSEQKRIVKKLDKIFENIEKAKENTEKSLHNCKEIFENYLNNIFCENNWEVVKLSNIADYFNGLTYSPKNVSSEGTIVLRSSNIQNDSLDMSDLVRVKSKVKDKLIVQHGDILMCSRNGSKRLIGKTAKIDRLTEKMTFGTFMMIIRSKYNPYLLWFLRSKEFRKQVSGGENTMINQITRYMLDSVRLPLPKNNELNKLVSNIEILFEQTKKIGENYEKKLLLLDELKKSVLQKTFAGEL